MGRPSSEWLDESADGVETAAKRHIDAPGWMRDHLTEAIGFHATCRAGSQVSREQPAPGEISVYPATGASCVAFLLTDL